MDHAQRVGPTDDELIEIFDGEEPEAPAESWADLLPPTVDAAPGDGAWAPPPPAPATPAPAALPTAAPFDWAAIDLPPPPPVAPASVEAAHPGRDEVELLDAPVDGVAFPGIPEWPVGPVPLPAPDPAPATAAKPDDAVPLPAPDPAPAAAAKPGDPVPLPAPPPVADTPAPAFAADVADEGADVLSLVAPPAPAPASAAPARRPARDLDRFVAGAKELFALGDFTGALELLGQAVAIDPRHLEAQALFERTQDTLVQMYESKLGRLSRTPRVLLQPDEIVWLNLDHRAGFVLAQIDGQVTLEDIFALSGMSRLDTAKILVELIEQGAIAS